MVPVIFVVQKSTTRLDDRRAQERRITRSDRKGVEKQQVGRLGPEVTGFPAASSLLVRGMSPFAAHEKAYWENYAFYGSVIRVFTALIGNPMYKCSTSEDKSDAKADN
jgi:hypothetical protein